MRKAQEHVQMLDDLMAIIKKNLPGAEESLQKVLEYRDPQALTSLFEFKPQSKAAPWEELVADMERYIAYSVHTAHPQYLNQLFGGFNFPAFAGEVLAALTNTSMYTYEMSPVATLMENWLIDKMLSYTGWIGGGGSFHTGGSNTNLVAMLLARNSVFKNAKVDGITALPQLAVLVSERSHFSLLKAANTIGIGQNGIVKVPLDAQGRMRGDALRRKMEETTAAGIMPFMVCSTAGTTETGSFDHIEEIAEVATDHELWHHVDGSWGGSAIMCEEFRPWFKGLEQVDSFSWNPHKLMSIPLVCSVLLVKDAGIMRREIQTNSADYIYHQYAHSEYDLGPASLQCGRRVDSLKLWLAWKYYGDEGYAQRIRHCRELALYCTEQVEARPNLELMHSTESFNVNFRYRAPEGMSPDQLNEALRYTMVQEGSAMVNYCKLASGLSLRLVLLNPDLERSDMDHFFDIVEQTAARLLASHAKGKD